MQWWRRPFVFPSGTSLLIKAFQLLWLPGWIAVEGFLVIARGPGFLRCTALSLFAGVFLFWVDHNSWAAELEARQDAALSCGCSSCLRAAGL